MSWNEKLAAVGQTASESIAKTVPPSVDVAAEVFDEAVDLAGRVQRLVDQLVGASPEDEAKECGQCLPCGVLPALRDKAMSTRWRIRDAHSALNRLNVENLG